MLNEDIEERVNDYMKDLDTDEPLIKEVIRDTLTENQKLLEENEDNATVTLLFENMMEDVDTKEAFNIRVFRSIQMIDLGCTKMAMLKDVMFNYERREIVMEFNGLDYELTRRFYEEENDKIFFENIEILTDSDLEHHSFMYHY